MTPKPPRIVDAHVHLWDPARSDWYPYLTAGQAKLNMGDVSGMSRRFDAAAYLKESSGWNVEKLVNVAAATGKHSIDETLELDRRAAADGQPSAIIGGLPHLNSTADAITAIDLQLAAPRFRGVRPMGVSEASLPTSDVIRALADRGLVYEVMTHPDQLASTARGLEAHGDLTVVIEHTGWPRNDSAEERALWKTGIDALASLGDNVLCKLSGLAMPLGSLAVEVMAPWLEYAIDAFGIDRCMFASNFPVDGMHGTLDQLWTTYSMITGSFSAEDRDKLFAGTAERVYNC